MNSIKRVGQALLAAMMMWLAVMPAFAQDLPGPTLSSRPNITTATPPVVIPANPGTQTAPAYAIMGPSDDDYLLGSGDKLALTVYGEDDLKSEFVVDGSGQVQIPLVGAVKAAGLSVRDFVAQVTLKLGDYLRNPRVSIQVLNYRPFYIIGEVNKPGEFPYEAGLNILGAVALAGGFSSRADDRTVYIRHLGTNKEQKYPADGSTRITPGDVIRIDERIF